MAKKTVKPPPSTLSEALARISELKALGRKWRTRAETAEGSLASLQADYAQLRTVSEALAGELADAHSRLGELTTQLTTAQDTITDLRANAQTQSDIDALDVIGAIRAARDIAVADVRRMVQQALSEYASSLSDDDEDEDEEDETEDLGDTEDADADAIDEDDDEAEDEEHNEATISDDQQDAIEAAVIESVTSPDSETDTNDITSDDVIELATEIVEGDIAEPEISLAAPAALDQLCHLINANAEELGTVWLETFRPFAENAAVKPRLLINEVLTTIFDDADQRQAVLASMDEASKDEFETVLQTILQANDGALAAVVPTPVP